MADLDSTIEDLRAKFALALLLSSASEPLNISVDIGTSTWPPRVSSRIHSLLVKIEGTGNAADAAVVGLGSWAVTTTIAFANGGSCATAIFSSLGAFSSQSLLANKVEKESLLLKSEES